MCTNRCASRHTGQTIQVKMISQSRDRLVWSTGRRCSLTSPTQPRKLSTKNSSTRITYQHYWNIVGIGSILWFLGRDTLGTTDRKFNPVNSTLFTRLCWKTYTSIYQWDSNWALLRLFHTVSLLEGVAVRFFSRDAAATSPAMEFFTHSYQTWRYKIVQLWIRTWTSWFNISKIKE